MGKKFDPADVPADEPVGKGSPSQAHSGCNQDAEIRRFGWAIVSRPGDAGEVWWVRNGIFSPQSVVLKIMAMEENILEG